MKRIIVLILILSISAFAEDFRKYIREGNKLYNNGNYNEAEIQYMKANEIKNSKAADFNIANSLYRQGKYDEASQKLNDLSAGNIDANQLADIYHNLGNSYFQNQEYEKSIDSYKNALRNNPNDMDARYNLEYAKSMLQQQQQEQEQEQDGDEGDNEDQKEQDDNKDGENDKEQDDNKDGENDKEQDDNKDGKNDKEQDDEKDGENEQNQQQEGDGDDKEETQQPEPRESEISKQDAERMLQALQEEERRLMQELKKQKGESRNLERNW